MALFDEAQRDAILGVADRGGLLDSLERVDAVADGLPPELRAVRTAKLVASGPEKTPRKQLRWDLEQLRALPETPENRAALRAYLDHLQAMLGDDGFAELAAVRGEGAGAQKSFRPIDAKVQLPERMIARDTTLPIEYLARGVAAASAVGKLTVPVHVGGVRDPSSTAKGTAWLLTPRHVVTCMHVLHAREAGQRATDDDLKLQTAASMLSFDDSGALAAVRLVAGWDDLDVGVVELAADVAGRVPLACNARALDKPTPSIGFYVNVIQYPGGEAKRVGLRSNAALDVTDRDVYYFTDTEQGSSGAACFDDDWRVIGVHRAWEVRKGVEYQGRTVGYANVGTRISVVLERLAKEQPDVRAAIRIA